MSSSQLEGYEQVNNRLKEILQLVSDESIPLDSALDLFDEAVKLGVQASTLLEEDIVARNERDREAPDSESGADAVGGKDEGAVKSIR